MGLRVPQTPLVTLGGVTSSGVAQAPSLSLGFLVFGMGLDVSVTEMHRCGAFAVHSTEPHMQERTRRLGGPGRGPPGGHPGRPARLPTAAPPPSRAGSGRARGSRQGAPRAHRRSAAALGGVARGRERVACRAAPDLSARTHAGASSPGISFYAEQKRHPLNGARLVGLRFFSSPLNPADAAHLLDSKPFCSMFFQPQRRDHRLRGALLDSPGLRAAPVPRCAPASDVGLSVRMRVLRPCRDSSPGSPRSSATQSLAHGHKWGSHLFQAGTAEGPQKGPHAIPQSCSCSAEEHLCPC